MDTRYNQLQLQAADRRHKLLDALSLHQLNRDAYIVDSWINEKVSWMNVYKLSECLGFKECQNRPFVSKELLCSTHTDVKIFVSLYSFVNKTSLAFSTDWFVIKRWQKSVLECSANPKT